jgi:hypothetical protein
MKRSYRLLKIHPKGEQGLAIYKKVGYHITIGDPEKTYTFEEFHVTFENNVEGKQAHFFFAEDASYKQVAPDKEHEQTKLYRADVAKNKLKPVEELRTEAKTYATAFVTDLNEKEAAEQKRIEDAKKKAEEDKKKAEEDAIKDVMTKASTGNHNGFKLVTKAYFGAEGKDNNEKRIKAKFPEETVKATLGPPAKVVWGSKQPATNQIIIEVKLKDFKKGGEIAYRQLRKEDDFVVTTAALN